MIHWEAPAPDVGLAILDRPERRNALNAEQCDALRGHLEANHHLRSIVIAGEGTSFCSGADIVRRTAEHTGLAHGKEDSFRPAFELLCDEIERHPAPIIAAVHGPGDRRRDAARRGVRLPCRRAGSDLRNPRVEAGDRAQPRERASPRAARRPSQRQGPARHEPLRRPRRGEPARSRHALRRPRARRRDRVRVRDRRPRTDHGAVAQARDHAVQRARASSTAPPPTRYAPWSSARS